MSIYKESSLAIPPVTITFNKLIAVKRDLAHIVGVALVILDTVLYREFRPPPLP